MRRSALLTVQLFAYVFASARITCSSSSSPLSRFASDNKPGREPNPIQWRAAFFAISSEGCALSTKADKMSRVYQEWSIRGHFTKCVLKYAKEKIPMSLKPLFLTIRTGVFHTETPFPL
jgi:hypothetical protein